MHPPHTHTQMPLFCNNLCKSESVFHTFKPLALLRSLFSVTVHTVFEIQFDEELGCNKVKLITNPE